MSEADARLSLLPSAVRSQVEEIVERFEDAWQEAPRPDLVNYLPAGAARQAVLVELVHVDLECRLKAGDAARVEHYLQRFPELAADAAVVLDLVAAEYTFRRRREPGLKLDEFLRRFPSCAEELGKRFGETSALRVTITVIAGPHQGKVFEFEGHDTFLVGRSKQAHFRLPQKDEYFSRVHFVVEVNPPHCRLMDMGSTNGTYVNNQRVGVADLRDGDLIQGGQTVLRVSVASAAGVEPTVPPAPALTVESLPPTPPAAGVCPSCGAPVEADAAGAAPLCVVCTAAAQKQPQEIPGYRIVRELGRGGMGVVYLAVHQAGGHVVALKTIRPLVEVKKTEVERFLREANILRQLSHPHIVTFRDMGEAKGRLFFAMDYVKGTDASRLIKQQGTLPVPRAVTMVCQMLEALAYAHGSGIVHRDIKPANLLITDCGLGFADSTPQAEMALLADFGLARTYQASQLSGLTMMGQMGGTVAYMPPEQITHFRQAKPPVDQYAAAATLYYLLTARHLFDFPREQTKQLMLILQEEPIPLRTRRPDVPEGLAQAVHRALAKDAAKRFADAEALRQALLPWRHPG